MPGRRDPLVGEEVRRLSAQGLSLDAIADQIGVTSRTVSRWRQKLGLSDSPTVIRRMTDEDRAALLPLFEEGMSREEVHRTTGWSRQALALHFPDRKWDRAECARHGAVIRNLGRALR